MVSVHSLRSHCVCCQGMKSAEFQSLINIILMNMQRLSLIDIVCGCSKSPLIAQVLSSGFMSLCGSEFNAAELSIHFLHTQRTSYMKPNCGHAIFSCLIPFSSSSYAGEHMESDWEGKGGTFEVNDNGVLERVGFHHNVVIPLTLLIYLAHKLQNGWKFHPASVLCLWQ